ncbi:MAG: ribonuclease III domain-containing protein [Alloprevotella sp.]
MIMNLLDRMKLPFRKNKEFLTVLYDILGFYPHNLEVYRVAFAHKSLSYHRDEANGKKDSRGNNRRQRGETTSKPLNNERLEYLGDAVLESIVSDILFRHFPNKREGFLTSTRSKMVQRDTLNKLAIALGLEKLIQAAQGTDMSHTNIAGNAFEALMGAIYLDRGYKHCHWFISNRVVGHHIDIDALAHKEVNFKSKLLEWSQKNRIQMNFRDSQNDQKERGFQSVILLEGIIMGRGIGRSKKESQQEAAKEALTTMRRDAKSYDSIFRAKEKRTAMEAEESFALPKIEEIEEALNREKPRRNAKGAVPVLESQKPTGRRKDADQAYDTAYDAEADFEVIDTPPAEPVLTAADYAAKGLPMPPSEDDTDETEASQTSRKTRRGRSGKTVTEALDEAAKGKKKAATRKPKTEKQPAETVQPQEEVPVVAEISQPTADEQPSLPETDSVPADLEEVAQAIQQEVAGESADILLAQQPETVEKEALPEATADEETQPVPSEATRESDAEQPVPIAVESPAETESAEAEESAEPTDAEEPAEQAEAPATPENHETNADDEADSPATATPPQSFDDSAPKPKLRHLSIDDFVFGIDPDEHKELSLDEVPEPEVRKPRKPNRRRRRPAAPTAETEAAETESTPATEKPSRKRKSSSKRNTKTAQTEVQSSEPQADEPQAEGKARKPRRRRKSPATPPAEA